MPWLDLRTQADQGGNIGLVLFGQVALQVLVSGNGLIADQVRNGIRLVRLGFQRFIPGKLGDGNAKILGNGPRVLQRQLFGAAGCQLRQGAARDFQRAAHFGYVSAVAAAQLLDDIIHSAHGGSLTLPALRGAEPRSD